jgi:uncharacterized Fe-S cluster-containing radical SAM superfamily protein
MSTPPPAFHLLAKPAGPICNLDCGYCFFLPKEMLYPGASFRVSDEVLEAYLRQLLEAHRTPDVTVAWQGGAPTLLGLDFFRRSMELVEKHRRPWQRVHHTIQTNGVLVDDVWARFLAEHRFLVGLSVDGPRAMHDAYQVDTRGRGSFSRVLTGYEHLRHAGVEVNVLSTVQVGTRVTDRSVAPDGFGRFLIDVFDGWVTRDVGRACSCSSSTSRLPAGTASCSGTPPTRRWSSWSDRTGSSPSVRPSATASPAPAGTATSGSPATVAAPATGSPPPPTARPDTTTSVPRTWRSSTTSTPPCGA